jgi:hypothetical protein
MSFEKNVFVNCPFDQKFIDDLLKPMLFVIVKTGLKLRLSLKTADSGQNRLDKIVSIIKDCKYSIHDLSLVKSKKIDEYSRMNIPFELGIDYGFRSSGIAKFKDKKFLILESVQYDYMKALSDINGVDIKAHNNNTEKIIDCVYSWASTTIQLYKLDPPLKMYQDFIDFNANLFDDK